MSDIAIRVENLGKMYRIGRAQQRHDTLRDLIVDTAKHITDWGRRKSQPDETIWALKDVSLDVKRGEVVGIIGRNGAGKSTLLKILSRITEPTTGRAEIHGRVGSLLEVGTGFHPELTGRENIYLNGAILGMRRAEIDRKFDEIVAFAEIEKFLDMPVKRYSSGMYVRLAFAVAAHLEPEILLVDEVLAVGDAAFQKKCLGKMGDVAKEGRTVLFVSHNMAAVQGLCGTGIVLDHGRIAANADSKTAVARYAQLVAPSRKGAELNVAQRSGTGPVRFRSFRCESGIGGTTEHLISGQRATFVIGLDGDWQQIRDLEVSVKILTHEGSLLANLSTLYFDEPLSHLVDAHGELRCVMPRLALRSGTYTVDLFCGNGSILCDRVTSAATFDVTDGDFYESGRITLRATGAVFLEHSWVVSR